MVDLTTSKVRADGGFDNIEPDVRADGGFDNIESQGGFDNIESQGRKPQQSLTAGKTYLLYYV